MLKVSNLSEKKNQHWGMGFFALLALVLSWAVVHFAQFGAIPQVGILLALTLAPMMACAYLIRPHWVVNGFLFAIPLLTSQEILAGLHIGELAVLFAVGLGIFTLFAAREKLVDAMQRLGVLCGLLIALAFVGLISVLANAVSSVSEIIATVSKPMAFAIVMLLVYVHNDSPIKIRGLLAALVGGGAVVAAYALYAHAMGWDYYAQYGYSRASGTFEHWNQLGGYLVLISLPTLAYALTCRLREVRWALVICCVMQFTALILSLTLGSLLGLLISGSLAVWSFLRVNARRAVGVIGLLILAFLSAWIMNPIIESRLGAFEERLVDRMATYAAGLKLAMDHFWLGMGSQERALAAIRFDPAGYRFTAYGETSVIPHNIFLSLWAEKGFIGLVLFIVVVIISLQLLFRYRPHRTSRHYWLVQGIAIGSLGFMVQNMTNDLLLHLRLGIVFFALIATVVRLNQLEEHAAVPAQRQVS